MLRVPITWRDVEIRVSFKHSPVGNNTRVLRLPLSHCTDPVWADELKEDSLVEAWRLNHDKLLQLIVHWLLPNPTESEIANNFGGLIADNIRIYSPMDRGDGILITNGLAFHTAFNSWVSQRFEHQRTWWLQVVSLEMAANLADDDIPMSLDHLSNPFDDDSDYVSNKHSDYASSKDSDSISNRDRDYTYNNDSEHISSKDSDSISSEDSDHISDAMQVDPNPFL